MNRQPRKQRNSISLFSRAGKTLPLILALAGFAILLPVAAQEGTAGEILSGMKPLLFSQVDFFSRIHMTETLTATAASAPNENQIEYFFFRRDAGNVMLLFQKKPAALSGYGFIWQEGNLAAFNPSCRCFSALDSSALIERAGFNFEEINPQLFSLFYPVTRATYSDTASGRIVTVGLETPAGKKSAQRLKLTLGGNPVLPLRIEYLNEKADTERTVTYLSYFAIEARYFPRLVRIDGKDGRSITLEFDSPSLNPVPDFVFTKAYLQELSQ